MWIKCKKCGKTVWTAKMGTLFDDYPTEHEHEHQPIRDFTFK